MRLCFVSNIGNFFRFFLQLLSILIFALYIRVVHNKHSLSV